MVKLYYFDVYGPVESIRMLLHKAGVQFEDHRLNRDQVNELKTQGVLEFGQVPMLELDDGTKLTQTKAIFRYLARVHKFEAENDMDYYRGESMYSHFAEDLQERAMYKVFFMPEGEEKVKAKAQLFEKTFPEFFERVDSWVAGKKYLLGDKLTLYDFAIGGFFHNMVLNAGNPDSAQWAPIWEKAGENLKKYVATMEAEFKDYLESRPKCSF